MRSLKHRRQTGTAARLALVIGSGSEPIATEICWSRDACDERATLDAAIALARRTISPAAP